MTFILMRQKNMKKMQPRPDCDDYIDKQAKLRMQEWTSCDVHSCILSLLVSWVVQPAQKEAMQPAQKEAMG